MSEFFLKHPIGKFLLDLVVGGIIGAGVAAAAFGPDVGGKDAIGLVVGGATNGIRSMAVSALIAALAKLRELREG